MEEAINTIDIIINSSPTICVKDKISKTTPLILIQLNKICKNAKIRLVAGLLQHIKKRSVIFHLQFFEIKDQSFHSFFLILSKLNLL